MKAKTILTADTETTGLADKAKIFDFAYVISRSGKVLIERSFLVKEVITNPRVMLGAIDDKHWRQSFGGKIFHHYIPGLHKKRFGIHSWQHIVDTLRDDMKTYEVDIFAAYNLRFDMGAIAKTQEFVGGKGTVLEYKPDLLCLWQFACMTVCKSQLYHDVAHQQNKANTNSGWVTKANNVRTNAEKVFAFLTGKLDFIESHTALEDAQIETEIFQRLRARKTRIPYNVLDHMPWRLAQRVTGRMKV